MYQETSVGVSEKNANASNRWKLELEKPTFTCVGCRVQHSLRLTGRAFSSVL